MTNIQNPLHVPEEFTPLSVQAGAGGTGLPAYDNASSITHTVPWYSVKRAGLFKFKITFLDEPDFPALREHINEYSFSTDELEKSYSDSGGCLLFSCLVTADSVREAWSLVGQECGIRVDFVDDSGNPVVSNTFHIRRGTIIPLQTLANNTSQPTSMQLKFDNCAFSLWDLLPA